MSAYAWMTSPRMLRTMRAKGEGTIFWRPDRKRWIVRVGGVARSAPTKSAALSLLRSLQTAAASPTRAHSILLRDYLRGWLAEMDVAPATYRQHEMIVRVHLVPALGSIPLAELTPQHVQRYLSVAKGSPRSLTHRLATLRRALTVARRQGLIRENVASLVDAPRVPHTEARALTAEQVRTFLEGTKEDRLWPLYVLSATTGMRQAELLGLSWSDVDWTAKLLTVRSTLHRVGGQWMLADPKTARSRRFIPLAPIAITALESIPKGNGPYSGLVFTTPSGFPIHGPNLLPTLYAHLERLNLPRIPFHGLRHSTASILLSEGVPARVVMELLGHSSIRTTMDTYSHVVPALTREAADKMQGAVG